MEMQLPSTPVEPRVQQATSISLMDFLKGATTTVASFKAAAGTISNGDVVRVVAYSSSSSSCTSEGTITMLVNEQIVANTINTASSSQTICSGDTPTALFASNVTGTPTDNVTYQWQSRQGPIVLLT